MEFVVLLHPSDEGDYWSEVPSLPGCGSQGRTVDEVVANTRGAIEGWLTYLRDKGRPVPTGRDLVVMIEIKPQMNADERGLNDVIEKVIGCAYTVANVLGSGFLERVYENALAHELRKSGLIVEQQACIQVCYDGVIVGDYVADLLIERRVLVELKTVRALDDIHIAQCLNSDLWTSRLAVTHY